MKVILNKDNVSVVKALTRDEQIALQTLSLSYDDLNDHKVLAMILGHGIDELEIQLIQTEYIEAVLALMLGAKEIKVTSIETCDSSVKILGKLYPEKIGQIRRLKMLGKDLMEVL